MSTPDLTATEELILLELAASRSGTPRRTSELAKALPHPAGGGRSPDLAPALERLAKNGLLEELPRAPRQRASRYRIQPPGREALHTLLGAMPARQSRTWKQKAARTLAVSRFLRLAPRTAAALVDQEALPVYFLAVRLGEEFQPGMTLESLARRTAAAALGLSNDQPETLWGAIFSRALQGENTASAPAGSDTTAPVPSPAFAALPFPAQVERAADSAREGWFGPRKLFIHRAWRAWHGAGGGQVDLAEFKTRLVASLRAGNLSLARADFTSGLNPADLEQAETRYGGEVFHFINFSHDKHP